MDMCLYYGILQYIYEKSKSSQRSATRSINLGKYNIARTGHAPVGAGDSEDPCITCFLQRAIWLDRRSVRSGRAHTSGTIGELVVLLIGRSMKTTKQSSLFVVVPFELVKIRMQDKAQAHKYKGLLDCVHQTVKAEGQTMASPTHLWADIVWQNCS